jgi:hypothetical protein
MVHCQLPFLAYLSVMVQVNYHLLQVRRGGHILQEVLHSWTEARLSLYVI